MRIRAAHRPLALALGLAVAAPLLGLGAASAGVAFTAGAKGIGDPYVPTEGNGGYQVLRYDLDVRYNPETNRLTGTATTKARATQDLSAFNFDLYGLTAVSATVDGAAATVSQSGKHELTVTPGAGIDTDTTFTTEIHYRGKPDVYHDPELGDSGWFQTDDGAIVVGEPEAGMFWFPVNEHPSDKARICVDATVPKGLRAVSNGLPAAKPSTTDGWTTWSWCARDPMASYLATLAIGQWRVSRSTSAAGVPVLNYVDRTLPKRVDRALDRTGAIVGFLARRVGPYPFEAAGGIADDHTSFYALENQTRPTYDVATSQWQGFPVIVAHELAHQWFGDSVALERWRDIWLNEGFATYLQWVWSAHHGGLSAGERFDRAYSRPASSSFWELRVRNPGYAHLFDAEIYSRGAMALHALRIEIGGDDFWRVLRRWVERHGGGNARTSDFQQLAERISGRQLDAFFRDWLVDGNKPHDPR